jgi:hypothetical protein
MGFDTTENGNGGNESLFQGYADGRRLLADFSQFKRYLIDSLHVSQDKVQKIHKINVSDPYAIGAALGMEDSEIAGLIASYLRLPQVRTFPAENVLLQLLPLEFCRWTTVVAILTAAGDTAFLLSNPFDWELMDVLKKHIATDQPLRLLVSDPPYPLPSRSKHKHRNQTHHQRFGPDGKGAHYEGYGDKGRK